MNLHQKGTGIKRGIGICIFFAVACVIAGFVVGLLGYQNPRTGSDHLNDLGNFGSYLQGTTASLWALAGVLLIFVAFLAQMRQFQIQHDSIKRQNFESAFFQLVNLHNQNVAQMRYFEKTSPGSGKKPTSTWEPSEVSIEPRG